MPIAKEEIQAWCWYLAAVHQAAGADGRTVLLPISYQCTRRADALVGCGTCYRCTKELIARALYVSTCPMADMDYMAGERANAVFDFVTRMDERLNAPDGLGDDYVEMNSKQFAKVMTWAAELIPMPGTVGSSAYAAFAAETVRLEPLDQWGRPRCLKMVAWSDAPGFTQCALTVDHDEDCDTLPTVPADPPAPRLPWPLADEDPGEYDITWRPRAAPALQNGVQQ